MINVVGVIKKMIININGKDYLITKTGVEDTYIMDSLDGKDVQGFLVSGGMLKQMISF